MSGKPSRAQTTIPHCRLHTHAHMYDTCTSVVSKTYSSGAAAVPQQHTADKNVIVDVPNGAGAKVKSASTVVSPASQWERETEGVSSNRNSNTLQVVSYLYRNVYEVTHSRPMHPEASCGRGSTFQPNMVVLIEGRFV